MGVRTNQKRANAPAGARARRRESRARKRRIQRGLAVAVSIVVVGGLAALLLGPVLLPKPGEHVFSQGNTHITEEQMGQFAYSTYPPTSGPHLGALAAWGVHAEPVANELQVHNLEDGGVMVQYNCPDGCPDLVAQLEGVVEPYHDGVILAPYPDMETRITLTAWERIDRLDEFDERRIKRFIRAYRGDDHHQ